MLREADSEPLAWRLSIFCMDTSSENGMILDSTTVLWHTKTGVCPQTCKIYRLKLDKFVLFRMIGAYFRLREGRSCRLLSAPWIIC